VESGYKLCHVCPFIRLSAWNNSAPTGQILMKLDIWVFFVNMSRSFRFHCKQTRLMGTLCEDH